MRPAPISTALPLAPRFCSENTFALHVENIPRVSVLEFAICIKAMEPINVLTILLLVVVRRLLKCRNLESVTIPPRTFIARDVILQDQDQSALNKHKQHATISAAAATDIGKQRSQKAKAVAKPKAKKFAGADTADWRNFLLASEDCGETKTKDK